MPHTIAHGLPDPFARRIARNTQIILADESNVGFVSDPAAGSGAIDALTEALCAAAWKEFRRIEAEGGIFESLQADKLQERVRAARRTAPGICGLATVRSWGRPSTPPRPSGR